MCHGTLTHRYFGTLAHDYYGTLLLWHIITMAHWHTPSSALVTVGPIALAIPIVNEWEGVELSEVPQLIVNSTQLIVKGHERTHCTVGLAHKQTQSGWLSAIYT